MGMERVSPNEGMLGGEGPAGGESGPRYPGIGQGRRRMGARMGTKVVSLGDRKLGHIPVKQKVSCLTKVEYSGGIVLLLRGEGE